MALSEIDRNLLERCLSHHHRAWQDFVDRYMGLVVHVVNHTAACRSIRISAADRDDLVADVFLEIVRNDQAVLRNFRGKSSLATYLTVIARRVVVAKLVASRPSSTLEDAATESDESDLGVQRIEDRDEVEELMRRLDGPEAEVVRLFHLEGKSYQEISDAVGMPTNSVGPVLTRARSKMRHFGADQPAGS